MKRNFKKLLNSVESLTNEELERANKKNPKFRSRHEGLGVILEEIWEANNNIKLLSTEREILSTRIFIDSEDIIESANDLKRYAIESAAELIQVAAMCQKLIDFER